MARAVATCLACVVLAILVPFRASAQVRHGDSACGYSVSVPADWVRFNPTAGRNVAILGSPRLPRTVLEIVSVRHALSAQATSQTLAQLARAVAAQNCLDCLRQTLKWIDRFSEGPRTVSYTIAADREPVMVEGQPVFYYGLDFYIYEDKSAQAPGMGSQAAGGFSRARMRIFIPVPEYRTPESENMAFDIVRSLQLTPVQGPCSS